MSQKTLNALIFSDIHSPDHFQMAPVDAAQIDVIFTLGDIDDGTLDYIIMQAQQVPVIGVPGNHDSEHIPGVLNVHKKVIDFKGIKIGGFGGSLRYKDDQPHHHSQWYAKWGMWRMPQVDIFLSHCGPPCTTEDEGPLHKGFTSFDRYLAKKPPKIWLHGHSYHAYDEKIGTTRIICVQQKKYLTNITI